MKWIQRKPKKKPRKSDSLVEAVAKIRGIDNIEDWMNPPKKYLHSPYFLENIDLAVEKITKAIYKGFKITIMADVDADGVFACSIMYNYLKELVDISNLRFVYAQRSKGHGVDTVIKPDNDEEIDKTVSYIPEDTELLIIVDSSSNSVEGCKKLSESGIDIIIIDHHQIERENPYATIVNCQMGDYPNKNLSGSAMAYKVCQVIDDYMDIDRAEDFIDLATMGIISDLMSLRDMENRYIVYQGLKNIKNEGLLHLLALNKVDMNEDISTTTISYKIAPTINSCTRYDKIELALELLTTDDKERIKEVAKEMIELNDRRKAEEISIVESALNKVNNSHKVAVLIDDSIDSGFRGLVAMQLVQRLNKPVIVLTEWEENGVVKYGGSARTLGQLPLKLMLEETKQFDWCQGHEGAFGLQIDKDKLDKALESLDNMIDDEDLVDVIYYDLEIDESEITEFDIKEIEKFSLIAGQGFPIPKFRVKGLAVEERTVLGSNKDTIKLVCDNNIACMKFRTNNTFAQDIDEVLEENVFCCEIEVVGSLNLNKFYNWKSRKLTVTNQILIDDYHIL